MLWKAAVLGTQQGDPSSKALNLIQNVFSIKLLLRNKLEGKFLSRLMTRLPCDTYDGNKNGDDDYEIVVIWTTEGSEFEFR
jgi:hypothetical protein